MRKYLIALLSIAASASAQLQWSGVPFQLSSPGVDALSQQIAMNSSGDVVAVWVENGVIKSNSLPYSGTWEPVSETLSLSGASNPQVVLDGNNNATAIWIESGALKASSKPSGGSWSSTPTVLSSMGVSSPGLAVDASGNAVAIWEEWGVIKSSTQLFGQNWSVTPDTLSSSGAYLPQIAIGSGGQVVAVWQHALSSIHAIYSASKAVNGAWSAADIISTPGLNSVRPNVTVDSIGNACVAWFSYIPNGALFSNVTMQTAYCSFGGAWETPYSFQEEGLKDPALLTTEIKADQSGDIVVVWNNSYDGATFAVNASILPVNGVWLSPATYILQNPLAYSFGLAVSGDDIVLASMYYDADNAALEVISSVASAGSRNIYFTFPVSMASTGSNGYPVLGATEISGNLYTVGLWLNNAGADSALLADTGIFMELLPPLNFNVVGNSQNFGVLQEYYNVLTWDPSPSLATRGYRIYRNNTYITELDESIRQFVDYNQLPGSDIVYTIAAIDYAGIESPAVSVHGP